MQLSKVIGQHRGGDSFFRRVLALFVLLAIAALVVKHLDLPGESVRQWLVQSELVVEVVAEATSSPTQPPGVPGLRAVVCRQGPPSALTDLPSSLVGRPASFCHFRFDIGVAQLLRDPNLDYGSLIEQTLAIQGAHSYTWTTREVVFGSEHLAQVLTSAVNLVLLLALALGLGWRPFADALQMRKLLIEKLPWPSVALWCSPMLIKLPFQWLRLWGPETLTPLLWSAASFTQSPAWLGSQLFQYCLAGPVTEELVFRVWLIPFLSRAMNPHVAVLVSAAAFSWVHGQFYVLYFAGGIAFGYLWLKYRNGLLCMAMHALSNLGSVLLMGARIAALPVVTGTLSP